MQGSQRNPTSLQGEGFFPGLFPNGRDLFLDLDDFIFVSSPFVVRDLGFKLGHLLGILPVGNEATSGEKGFW